MVPSHYLIQCCAFGNWTPRNNFSGFESVYKHVFQEITFERIVSKILSAILSHFNAWIRFFAVARNCIENHNSQRRMITDRLVHLIGPNNGEALIRAAKYNPWWKTKVPVIRAHSRFGLGQWETMLQCNVVSQRLSPCTKSSLIMFHSTKPYMLLIEWSDFPLETIEVKKWNHALAKCFVYLHCHLCFIAGIFRHNDIAK